MEVVVKAVGRAALENSGELRRLRHLKGRFRVHSNAKMVTAAPSGVAQF
jgi:hypothetical protein